MGCQAGNTYSSRGHRQQYWAMPVQSSDCGHPRAVKQELAVKCLSVVDLGRHLKGRSAPAEGASVCACGLYPPPLGI